MRRVRLEDRQPRRVHAPEARDRLDEVRGPGHRLDPARPARVAATAARGEDRPRGHLAAGPQQPDPRPGRVVGRLARARGGRAVAPPGPAGPPGSPARASPGARSTSPRRAVRCARAPRSSTRRARPRVAAPAAARQRRLDVGLRRRGRVAVARAGEVRGRDSAGDGAGVVVQGAFLLVLDAVHAARLRTTRL